MPDDVVINKAAIIERCVARVREEYGGDERNLLADLTRQDSILLNLQRACEAAIDLAMHLVAVRRLGVPQESREAFEMLAAAGIVTAETAAAMKRMVGFHNIAVHEYQVLDLAVARSIVVERLGDFTQFAATVLTQSAPA